MDTWKAEAESSVLMRGTATLPLPLWKLRAHGDGDRLCLKLCPVGLGKHGALQMPSVEVLTS